MSTRSRIGLELSDGYILSVYHHWDGYTSWLGRILQTHYNSYEKASELIDGGETLHQNLSVKVHHCKEDWLIIHCDDEYYQTEYQNQYILTEEFNYSQRWGKDKNHNKSKVNHLYISNREPIFEPSTNP